MAQHSSQESTEEGGRRLRARNDGSRDYTLKMEEEEIGTDSPLEL